MSVTDDNSQVEFGFHVLGMCLFALLSMIAAWRLAVHGCCPIERRKAAHVLIVAFATARWIDILWVLVADEPSAASVLSGRVSIILYFVLLSYFVYRW